MNGVAQQGNGERRPLHELRWWIAVVAATVVALSIAITTLWLLSIAGRSPSLRIEAIRIGLTVGAGTGGAVALLLAFRRQWLNERAQSHTEDVARDNVYDATQRRVTDLYGKAVEQLGHDEAAVRLGGMYSLERLAQDHIEHRQTVVDMLCAYLKMPFPLSADAVGAASSDDLEENLSNDRGSEFFFGGSSIQETQVRLAAQRILANHLQKQSTESANSDWAEESHWMDMQIDLTGATLIDFSFSRCHVRSANFRRARFYGITSFRWAEIKGIAQFHGAQFLGHTSFRGARLSGDTWFDRSHFGRSTRFDETCFERGTWFTQAQFSAGVTFNKAVFSHGARFRRAQFMDRALFDRAQFRGNSGFDGALFRQTTWRQTHFLGTASFRDIECRANASFEGAQFHLEASFGGAVFNEGLSFKSAEFTVAPKCELVKVRLPVTSNGTKKTWANMYTLPPGWHIEPSADDGTVGRVNRDQKLQRHNAEASPNGKVSPLVRQGLQVADAEQAQMPSISDKYDKDLASGRELGAEG